MATKSTKVLRASNADIARAIWNDASLEYQNRIPAPDQGDITKTFEMLQTGDYTPQLNEFVNTLVNRVGSVMFRSKVWTNPLGVFKRGMMEFGDTIEEIAHGIIKAKRYDPNDCMTDVFACSPPPIEANFHSINRMDRYDMTINRQLLRRAFIDEYGISEMLDGVMTIPQNSDEYDEYLIMRNLIAEYARIDGFYKVQVPDVVGAAAADRADAARTITEIIRGFAGRLRFFSGAYNPSGIPTFSKPQELVLIATPEFSAILDVNVIAQAFNVSAADLNVRVIEVDTLGVDGAQAILCDENFFVCADTLIEFSEIFNPKSLGWNYFLHHHGVYSVSRFVNAIMFTTEAGTSASVPSVTVTAVNIDIPAVDGVVPEFAPIGGSLRLRAIVDGTVTPPTEGYTVPQGVVWTITGTGGKPVSQRTYIDAEGVLHVSQNETNTSVTVTATTTYIDPTKPMNEQTYLSVSKEIGIGAALPTPDPGNDTDLTRVMTQEARNNER